MRERFIFILITNNAITRQDMGWGTEAKVLPSLVELASLLNIHIFRDEGVEEEDTCSMLVTH